MLMIDVITIINLVTIFANKFKFSIMTLNNVIYLLFIAFFIVLCCLCYCAVLSLHFINNILRTNVSAENYYQLITK